MQRFYRFLHLGLFFVSGAATTSLVLVSSAYLTFSFYFRDKIYPGVAVENITLSELTKDQARLALGKLKNSPVLQQLTINLSSPVATTSVNVSKIKLQVDTDLMINRAYSVGRQTANPYWNFQQIISAWQGKIILPLEVTLDSQILNQGLSEIAPAVEKKPIDAVFQFQAGAGPDGRGRVAAFTSSRDGLAIDREKTKQEIIRQTKKIILAANGQNQSSTTITIPVFTKTLSPNIKSSTADEMGIKNLLGHGESFFYDSIPGRIYNIGLGAEKINGSLVKPGEIFSFDNAIGTISAIFGFAKAYVIKEGKTVLDDGGGVCQVSTTLYRAVLNAGLPVIEREAHTYRVSFYEQGGYLPGLDATVFPPSPDFKFKNDTGNYLLIQATIDYNRSRLIFDIFGTDDGRKTTILGPYILSTSLPPEPIYQDDPTLPVGQIKQIDTAHAGANVYFKRTVTRSGETLIDETVRSNFIPWPARYLKGTKQP